MDFTKRNANTKRPAADAGGFKHSEAARPSKKGKVYGLFFAPPKTVVQARRRRPVRDGGGADKAGEFVAVFPSKPKISEIPGVVPDPSRRFQMTHQCKVVALHNEGSEEVNQEPQDVPLSSVCWGSFQEEIALQMEKYPHHHFIGPGYRKSDGTISDIQLVAGGSVEPGETPLEAITGEVAEELGFTNVQFLEICSKEVRGSQHTLFLGRIKA